MADATKRINLTAPLLSVRRHGGTGTEAAALPSCKPGATPGGVPFGWEHRPGHPKSVRTRRAPPPPPAAPDEAALAAPVSEESERFSDALSLVDSCLTVNCSVTGLRDAGAEPVACRGVMMDRFLPAAQALAVGSPQRAFRKAGAAAATGASTKEPARLALANARTGDSDSFPRRLPVEHSPANNAPSNNAKDRSDDDEWDEHSTRGFASKRCGLLPTRCVKSTLTLLYPAPAIRRRGGARRGRGKRFLSNARRGQRATKPLVQRPRDGQHLGDDTTLKSWEDVYMNSLLRSDRGGRKGPASTMASELDRTVRELYTDQGGGVHPKAGQLGLLLLLDRSERCADNHHGTSAQSFSEAGEPALLLPPRIISRPAKVNDGKKFRRDAGYDFPLLLEGKIVVSRDIVPLPQPLLPPPPPNAPSESWLSRALPSVSSKPPATSFLGIRVQPKNRAPPPYCSSDQTKVIVHARPRQIRTHHLQK